MSCTSFARCGISRNKRTALLWTTTQRVIAIHPDVSVQPIVVISMGQGSKKDFGFLNLENGTDRLFRNVRKKLHCMLRSSPEERSSYPLRDGSLKSRNSKKSMSSVVLLQVISYDREFHFVIRGMSRITSFSPPGKFRLENNSVFNFQIFYSHTKKGKRFFLLNSTNISLSSY